MSVNIDVDMKPVQENRFDVSYVTALITGRGRGSLHGFIINSQESAR